MAIPTPEAVAAQICTDLGNASPLSSVAMTAIVKRILDAVKQADVLPGTFAVPIIGAAGTTPITVGTKGTLA